MIDFLTAIAAWLLRVYIVVFIGVALYILATISVTSAIIVAVVVLLAIWYFGRNR